MPKIGGLHTLIAQIGRKMQKFGFHPDKPKNCQSGPNLDPTATRGRQLKAKGCHGCAQHP